MAVAAGEPVPEDGPAQVDPVQGVAQQVPGPGRQRFEPGHVFFIRAGTVQTAQIDADARHMSARAAGSTLQAAATARSRAGASSCGMPSRMSPISTMSRASWCRPAARAAASRARKVASQEKGAAFEQTDDIVRPARGARLIGRALRGQAAPWP